MNDKEWYAIGLDTSEFRKQAKQTKKDFTDIGNSAYNAGMKVDRSFQMIGKGALTYLGVRQLAQYSNAIIQVRGEFQQLGIAFETMLGSKAAADKLMAETVRFAQKTPFTLTDVASNIKQLMAMGIATENVMDTMKALGDVAAGVSVPISRIAVNYGQVATLGKLQSRELKDFAMAGIPLIDELAKNLGKTKNEINDLVSAGKIGFPEVEKAFQTMASEGGKFYDLMEKQNASVTGQISNLQDKIEVMMNKIGQSNEGIIYSGISGASYLVENYEAIGKVLIELVSVYGAYRAALITITALNRLNVMIMRQAVLEKRLAAAASIQLSNAEAVAAARTKLLTIAQRGLVKSLKATKAALLSNPYVLAASLVAGLAYAVYKLATAETAAEKAHRKYNEELEKTREAKESLISRSNELISIIHSETESLYAQLDAYKKLQKEFPNLFKNMSLEEFKKIPVSDIKLKINVEKDTQGLKALEDDYKDTLDRIRDLEDQYNSMSLESDKYGPLLNRLQRKITFEKQYLKNQEIELENAKKLKAEAEFEAKPNSEKLNYYNTELEALKKQRAEIEDTLLKSEEVNGQWGQFGVQTIINTGKLEEINAKIDETAGKIGKLTGQAPQAENKSYWEKQKEEAKEALDAMTEAQQGSKEWNDNFAKLTEAQNKLKIWDYSSQLKEQAEEIQKQLREQIAERIGLNIDIEPTLKLKQEELDSLKEELSRLTDESSGGSDNLERRLEVAKKISALESEINDKTIKGRKAKVDVVKATQSQLKPMKQLTDEQIEQLEIERDKIDAQRTQIENQEELAEALDDNSELFGALSYATGEINRGLGETIGRMADISNNAGNVVKNWGVDTVAAISSGIGVAGNIIGLFASMVPTEEQISRLKSFNSLTSKFIENLNTAQTSFKNIGVENYTDQMKALEYAMYGVAMAAETIDVPETDFSAVDNALTAYRTLGFSIDDIDDKIAELSQTLLVNGPGLTIQQREDIEATLDSYNKLRNEYNALVTDLTGTSGSSIADSIIDGFRAGKSSMIDFADDFESLMSEAVLNALSKQMLTPALEKWNQDLFNSMSDADGLTAEEIEDLRDKYQEIIQTGYDQAEALEKVTGLNLTGDDNGGYGELQGISRSITEETGSLLVGQFMAMREDLKMIGINAGYSHHLEAIDENTKQATDYLMQAVGLQQQIVDNTGNTNKRLTTIEDKIAETNRLLSDKL